MHGCIISFFGAAIGLAIGGGLDCETQANPSDTKNTHTTSWPKPEDLTEEEKAFLEFLQQEGIACLFLIGGKDYLPITSNTGITDMPKDEDKPNDSSGGPTDSGGGPTGPSDGPPDPPDGPPEQSPEPGTLVLGLLGLGATSLTYLRRRKKGKKEIESLS